MCSHVSLPEEWGHDLFDMDLINLSMDFDAAFMTDPLLDAVLPDVPEPPPALHPCQERHGSSDRNGVSTPLPPVGGLNGSKPNNKGVNGKILRTREKNRLAQARYRERQKQEFAEAQAKVSTAQHRLQHAKFRLAAITSNNQKLVRRAALAASALVTLVAPSNRSTKSSMHPALSSASPPRMSGSIPAPEWPLQAEHGGAETMLVPPAIPPLHSPATSDTAIAQTCCNAQNSCDSLIDSRAQCSATSGSRCSSTDLLHPFLQPRLQQGPRNEAVAVKLRRQPSLPKFAHRAPLHPAFIFTHPFPTNPGPPLPQSAGPSSSPWPWPRTDECATPKLDIPAAHTAGVDTGAKCLSSHEERITDAIVASAASQVRAHQVTVGEAAGVRPEDIVWFLQTPYAVTPVDRDGAGWAGGYEGGAGAAQRQEMMSCSTALASAHCCASFFTFFICSRLEGACLAVALDRTSWGCSYPGADVRGRQGFLQEDVRTIAAKTAADTLVQLDMIVQQSEGHAGDFEGTCGMGGRFLISAGVEGVVRTIATRYRPLLPWHLWIATCADFVAFMMSKQWPDVAKHRCPMADVYDLDGAGGDSAACDEEDGGGTTQRHVPSRCPKCSVVACLARGLRDVIQEGDVSGSGQGAGPTAQGGDSLVAGGTDEALLERAQEIYACFALLISQSLVDAPHLLRHLRMLASTHPGLLQTQADTVSLELYKNLNLQPQQQRLAAAVWLSWGRRRQALDERFTHALSQLANTVCAADLPMHELLQLCDLLGCAHAPSCDAAITPSTSDVGRLYPAHSSRCHSGERGKAGVGAGECACSCTCGARHAEWQQRLLGARGASTAAVLTATQQLRDVHDVDAAMLVDMTRALCMPGALFSVRQLVAQLPVALRYGLPMVDWLHLCMSAAQERKHNELLQTFA